jgi:hypothetical protein
MKLFGTSFRALAMEKKNIAKSPALVDLVALSTALVF